MERLGAGAEERRRGSTHTYYERVWVVPTPDYERVGVVPVPYYERVWVTPTPYYERVWVVPTPYYPHPFFPVLPLSEDFPPLLNSTEVPLLL